MNKKVDKNKQIYSPVQDQPSLVDNTSSDSSYELANSTSSNTSEEKCAAGQSESDSQSILSKVECSTEKKNESSYTPDTEKHEKKEYFVDKSQMLSNEMRTLSLSTIFSQKVSIHPLSLINPFNQFLKCYNLQAERVDQLRSCFASNKTQDTANPDQQIAQEKPVKNLHQDQSICNANDHQTPGKYTSDNFHLKNRSNKSEGHLNKRHGDNFSDTRRPNKHLTIPERIDMDQPRSHSVPYKEGRINNVGLIGEDFSFLKRLYLKREEKYNLTNNIKYYNQNDMILNQSNYHNQSSLKCEQFKNDVKMYLQKKSSGSSSLNINSITGGNKVSKYGNNTNILGIRGPLSPYNILFNDIAKDQEGSRFLQKRLDQSGEDVWKFLTKNLNILELCTDLFGNYVIQKLIDNPTCRTIVGENIMDKLVELSSNTFGCRVVQKLITNSEMEDSQTILTIKIISKLRPHLLTLVYDANGNHVVQRVVAHYSKKETQCQTCLINGIDSCNNESDPQCVHGHHDSNEESCRNGYDNHSNLSNIFEKECIILAKHKYGCRVLQKLFETSLNNYMVDQLVEQSIDLAENQYGNYVLQHIIGLNYEYCQKITDKTIPHLYEYSTHKFASNVIETIIHALHSYKSKTMAEFKQVCDPEDSQSFMLDHKSPDTFTFSPEDMSFFSATNNENCVKHFTVLNSSPSELLLFVVSALLPHILPLSTDKYGNYVVQRILETDLGYLAKNELLKNIGLLKGQVYAKGIVNKIKL